MFDWINKVKTPCYVIDEKKLINNLEVLHNIEKSANCKILLAQKAFSMFSLYDLIGEYISGTTASGLFEAKLGFEEMGGKKGRENHVFSPAYSEKEFDELLDICDHIVFNSLNQWKKYREKALNRPNKISFGLRVNPEISTQDHAIYDPCSPYSRLGITIANLKTASEKDLQGIEGLHFHTLCEQNADALAVTLDVFKENFGPYIRKMKWINFGGGHHITRSDYNRELLIKLINDFRNEYNLDVYLEPGEAVALNAGYLVAEVLDIVHNGMNIAILDASAACHMPDVIEMPYRPNIIGAGESGEKKYTYRLGGNTCLAGDIIGDYSFDDELKAGDKLVFCDMAIYSIVKNNTFNGMPLPSIAVLKLNEHIEIIKEFSYSDFKNRLS